jgi:formylglycine-generating enzyme required for sulfatase activity
MARQLFRRFQLQSAFIWVLVAALFMGLMVSPLEVQAQTTKQSTVSEPAPASSANANTAPKRRALLIGNNLYQHQSLDKLPNASRDADAMADALKAAGFITTVRKDLSHGNMVTALEQFIATINSGDEVVVFFSGHGIQVPQAGAYLLPVDISITTVKSLQQTATELEPLMKEIADSKAGFSMLIIDACRNDPFAAATKSPEKGIYTPQPPKGQVVVLAAGRNQKALENLGTNDKDPNGVFTREFIKRMKIPGLEITALMKEVQASVEDLASSIGHQQRPGFVSEARGNFYFFGPTAVQITAAAASTASSVELVFWASAERLNTITAYQNYLNKYPKGEFVTIAQTAIEGLRAAQTAASAGAAAQRPVVAAPPAAAAPQPAPAPQPVPIIVAAPVPTAPQRGQTLKDCADCPEMVIIPAGSFMMGSPESEVSRDSDEGPQRNITLKSFAMGKTEVTQGQWKAIMGSNPSRFQDCGDDCPVESVSWNDAQEYIKKLNAKTGKTYSLPSESQWEYAARGGTTTAFHTGNTITPEQANFNGDYTYNGSAKGVYRGKTIKVGSLNSPNKYGLHDMHGNVREWVQDCYVDKYGEQPVDGSAHDVTNCQRRVRRGGSWVSSPQYLRSALRNGNTPDSRNDNIGFRLARTL